MQLNSVPTPVVPTTIYDPQGTLFDSPAPRAPLALEAAPYKAPAEQLPFWYEPHTVGLTQEASPRTPDASGPGNGNCGPTSAIMALRLVGLDAPGFNGERTQKAIDWARKVATGTNDDADWTNAEEMKSVLDTAGARARHAGSVHDMMDSVRQGKVAIVLGNAAATGWAGASYLRPTYDKDYWAGHFVVASRYYPDRDMFAINDPGDTKPYFVTAEQLQTFATGGDGRTINPGYSVIVEGPGTDLRPSTVRRGDHAWPKPPTDDD